MWKDLKSAGRGMRHSPTLTAAAVVSIALGLGANTAVFNVAMAFLARNMPEVGEPGRLVAIHRTYRGSCCSEMSWPVFGDIRQHDDVFEDAEAHYPLLSVTSSDAGEPERLWGQVVSLNYFRVLRTRLSAGRGFADGESGVVVISHSLWQRRFGSDPSTVGRRLVLNHGAFTIVGVAPPRFRGPDFALGADLWVPITSIDSVMPQRPSLQDRTVPWLLVYARLRPGVSVANAQAQLDVLAGRLAHEQAKTDRDHGFVAEPARAFHPSYRGAVLNATLAVAALVAVVLIVACANVANILMSRATARRKETAIKAALGASRLRLIREMVVESTAISLLGGIAGFGLSQAILSFASAVRLPVAFPVDIDFHSDGRVFAFAMALALVTGVLFGLMPAIRASRPELVPALKDYPCSRPHSGWGVRDVLVLVQVSSSVLVLVVTSLFLHSLAAASSVNPGFRTDHVLLADLDPRTEGAAVPVMERIRLRVEALPGVASASFSDLVPPGLGARAANIRRSDDAGAVSSAPIRSDVFQAGPGFLKTLGIPVLRGSDFTANHHSSQPVAIVNAALAARLWPHQDPLGRMLRRDGQSFRVIGVVGNTRTRALGDEERASLYVPLKPDGADPTPFGLKLIVQTTGDSGRMASSVRQAIREVAPHLAISNVRTMAEHIDTNLVFPRVGALIFGAFGAIAILLTATGLYGVVSYSVACRTREFGIRLAIGARYEDLLRGVLGRGLLITAAGTTLGLTAALATTHLLRSLLFGITPTDPVSFVVTPFIVICVSLAACYVPARRAARVDPIAAFRN